MRHLNQLVLDVAGGIGPVVLGNGRGGTYHHIPQPGFTHVAGAVIGREARNHGLCEFVLTVHEHVLPGDKYIVEHHQGFLAAKPGIALVDVAGLQSPGIATLTPVNVGEALCIPGYHADNGVVAISRSHVHGGHDANPVAVEATGHVRFGPGNIEAALVARRNVQKQVRV